MCICENIKIKINKHQNFLVKHSDKFFLLGFNRVIHINKGVELWRQQYWMVSIGDSSGGH